MNVEWNNLCRLCARFDMSGIRIFERQELDLSDKIKKYLSITVKLQDELPKLICQTCTNQLVLFDRYAKQCLQVQAMFGTMLQEEVNSILDEFPKKEQDDDENCNDHQKKDTESSVATGSNIEYRIKQEVEDVQAVDINNIQEDETLPKKCEDFPKLLVGAAKRKAKMPKLVHHLLAKAINNVYSSREKDTNSVQVKVGENEASSDDDFYPFKCNKCGIAFSRKQLLEVHHMSHIPFSERPFACSKCNRRFNSGTRLRRHEETHIPREERCVDCPLCDKTSMSSHTLRKHMQTAHSGQPRHKCEFCGQFYKSRAILQKHEIIHNGNPFKCAHCNKSFKTKPSLKLHVDTHNETPYQCPKCPMQLSTKRTLRNHLVVHNTTKAYLCATCGKAFKRSKGLKNHQTQHTGQHPYTCMFCFRTFASGPNCRAHKRKMHAEELRHYEASLAAGRVSPNQNIQISSNTVALFTATLTELQHRTVSGQQFSAGISE